MLPAGPASPRVGIFWQVWNRTCPTLVIDSVPAGEAEALAREHLPDVIRATEYDEWPRGRVVFNRETGRFTLYADTKLRTPATIAMIAALFQLPADGFDARGDAHYRT